MEYRYIYIYPENCQLMDSLSLVLELSILFPKSREGSDLGPSGKV